MSLVFLINYITAGTSYCLRTYFPGPNESQETYNARQQHLLSPSHQTTSNCNSRLYFLDVHDGKFKNFSIVTPILKSWFQKVCYILSDDTEFNSSGIGNITGTKYFENYDIYKQTLIEGLARGNSKSHFLDLFATWNREVFPRSQVSDVIPDSQPASCSAGNMGDNLKQVGDSDMNNVADILKQLSFEENEKEGDLEEEDNRSDGGNSDHRHVNDDHNSNKNSESDYLDCNSNDVYGYGNEPPQFKSLISMDSVPSSSSAVTEPTTVTTMAISSQTPETLLTDEVAHHDKSSKAPPTGKKPSRAAPVQKGQSRSSSRLTKAPADPLSLPSPVQPIDTTNDVPPPMPLTKRGTRVRAAATKGKSKARTWR